MWIGGKAAAWFQFAAKIFQLLHGEAAFEERAGVDAGRGVSLEIYGVALELRGARAKEMVEADFVERGGAGVGGDVAADVVLDAMGADAHAEGVPAHDALHAPLEFLIARETRLYALAHRHLA